MNLCGSRFFHFFPHNLFAGMWLRLTKRKAVSCLRLKRLGGVLSGSEARSLHLVNRGLDIPDPRVLEKL
uniref:Uncharacterized protein n=1 Tax=Anguilla anguilla TaxID=7936 RepID=A0A0E9WVI1_ANGAN